MAFRLLIDQDALYPEERLLGFAPLNAYRTIGEEAYSDDRDGILAQRSAFELVRDQLSDAQSAELDQVDAYWQAHPAAFNQSFALWHHQADRATVLSGLVEDGVGGVPVIPRGHWWWRPIEAA